MLSSSTSNNIPARQNFCSGRRERRFARAPALELFTMLPLTQPKEKRRAERHQLGRVAAIVFGLGDEQHYCLVTDISEGGVRLHINELNVPDDFSLRFAPDV